MHWSDEVGVADAGYVRCGYLLTVPERLREACRGNVELLQGLGLDTRFLEPGEIAAAEPELSLEGVAGAAYEPDGGGAEQPIALRRLQVSVLRQPIGAPLPTAVCSDAVTNVVVRPDRGQQFYAVAYFGDEPLERADDCDHGISDGYEAVVRRAVSERYPRLGGFELVRGFAGPYDSSPDWNPIIGPCPGIEGLYLALAWCGHGFKLSPAVGEVVAAEVTGRTPPIDVADLRPTRFAE